MFVEATRDMKERVEKAIEKLTETCRDGMTKEEQLTIIRNAHYDVHGLKDPLLVYVPVTASQQREQ